MVSGDVFRSPADAVLLCVQVGSGVQIITSATLTLFFAALGKQPIPCSLRPSPDSLLCCPAGGCSFVVLFPPFLTLSYRPSTLCWSKQQEALFS